MTSLHQKVDSRLSKLLSKSSKAGASLLFLVRICARLLGLRLVISRLLGSFLRDVLTPVT
jgi:hypothetical protein